ncbi:U3 small nucleolar RNA-associated protein 15 [Mytilus galloprovincialis]|uniref:U3 small nucleolar RNA-associated protein 15 homolog n=1 Tax=Mytilus galloprovincialis TaxID=29158 RepID=A0A8B6BZ32_MYTGA|nr:U3 small nucleolar RNA-associated protein 15 [Mytilus galloprovincialis]
MAASFKKTAIKTIPRVGEIITTDTLFWKSLEVPVTKKEYGPITHIEFSPVEPHNFAVTNSTRVQIYSPKSLQVVKTISRFREQAHCGSFRDDGRLLVAGGDGGEVKLFDVDGKSLLRVFKGHKGSVHVSKFLSDRLHLFSGSDDNTVRLWDIPTENQLISYKDHQDYVRCGVASMASTDIILTGSYDHTVKMWDTRTQDCAMSVNHGHPVESVLMFPSGGIFMSAGGNVIKVWDALAGGRLLTTLCHHHKTITTLTFCKNYQRLISGSIDRHLKIYDVSTYQVVHTLDVPGSVLSVGVPADDNLLVVGQNYTPSSEDQIYEHKKKEKIQKYDKFFRKFEYSKALDAAIHVRTKEPEVTVSVIQELIRREGLKPALAARDDKSLGFIIRFIQRNISNPRFTSTLTDVAGVLLDMYNSHIGQCAEVDSLLQKLRTTVKQEVDYMKQLMETMGTMDMLFAAVSTNQNKQLNSNSLDVLTPSVGAQTS